MTDSSSSSSSSSSSPILVLGLGNALCGDDAFGPLVVARMRELGAPESGLDVVDGGTLGLILVAHIAEAGALIVVDAGRTGQPPGTLNVHQGAAIDRVLGTRADNAHGIGLADLLASARLAGWLPERRALVTVEAADITWGQPPSAVEGQIDAAIAEIRRLIADWRSVN